MNVFISGENRLTREDDRTHAQFTVHIEVEEEEENEKSLLAEIV